VSVEYAREASAGVWREGDDGRLDLVEREDVRAASGWLDAFFDCLEDTVNDLERSPWT
jgi:hypothetical protein